MPWDLIDFKDEVVTIINYGKYEFIVTNGIPAWNAGEGEALFYVNGTDRRFYVFMSGAWNWVQWGGPNTASSGDSWWIHDADQNTYVNTEKNADENKVRGAAGGTEIFSADSAQFAVNNGIRLGFESNSGNTYMVWDSANTYLQMYIDGGLRAEF
jgi:hypothetical protein